MASALTRTRPLIAVLSRVPLFVEAMNAAFEGIADVAPVAADDQLARGLIRAYRPDVAIVEGCDVALIDNSVPCVRVDLEAKTVELRRGDSWTPCDVELSPEAIRNVAVAAVYGGEPA